VRKHYGFNDLYAMQNSWLDWVKAGRPQLAPVNGAIASLASHTAPAVVRGQSPDDEITPIQGDWSDVLNRERKPNGTSVYAAMAIRAKGQPRSASAARAARSVYDASLPKDVVRR
jgi:hypothetical protein